MISNAEKTILMLDDDLTFCSLIEMEFERDGFELVCCHTGPDALKLVRKNSYLRFDMMLLDMMLPGTSGFTILQELSGAQYQNIPIVVLTARVMDRGTVDMICSQPNVRGLMSKPVEVRELRKKMYAVMEYAPALKTEPGMVYRPVRHA
mgnify:CR=1 FL=1